MSVSGEPRPVNQSTYRVNSTQKSAARDNESFRRILAIARSPRSENRPQTQNPRGTYLMRVCALRRLRPEVAPENIRSLTFSSASGGMSNIGASIWKSRRLSVRRITLTRWLPNCVAGSEPPPLAMARIRPQGWNPCLRSRALVAGVASRSTRVRFFPASSQNAKPSCAVAVDDAFV